MALGNANSSEVVIRVVNWGATTQISIVLENVIVPSSVTLTVLQGETGDDLEQNTPWNPTEVSPKQYTAAYSLNAIFTLGANTFTVFSFEGIAS